MEQSKTLLQLLHHWDPHKQMPCVVRVWQGMLPRAGVAPIRWGRLARIRRWLVNDAPAYQSHPGFGPLYQPIYAFVCLT